MVATINAMIKIKSVVVDPSTLASAPGEVTRLGIRGRVGVFESRWCATGGGGLLSASTSLVCAAAGQFGVRVTLTSGGK